jgi:lysine 2,3-aminomutase
MSKSKTTWRGELKKPVANPAHLAVSARMTRRLETVSAVFPMRIPHRLARALDPADRRDPIRRQLVPDPRELAGGGSDDPLGEEPFQLLPGVIQRFEDRLLALVSSVCPVHCRHCNRKRFWANPPAPAGPGDIERTLQRCPKVREVILSGGEPLLLGDRRLSEILRAARSSGRVELLRIHTRIPWSLPARITPGLIGVLRRNQPLWLSVHFNHARELNRQTRKALGRLRAAGIPLVNQAVLLRGVNDSIAAQQELGRALLAAGVKPHYLFQLDRARGTLHFQVPMPRALGLIAGLRRRYSGLLVPHLLVDLPGQHGKVPITPSAVVRLTKTHAVIKAPDGSHFSYATNGGDR